MNTVVNSLPIAGDPLTKGFQSYLNYANSQPVLSLEEEKQLFERFHQNDDLEAVRKIILSHLRFVAHVAKGYLGYGLPLEDLVQEGNIGLMKSVKRFDLSHGVRLATFAVHWIKSEIHEYVLTNWKLLKVATTKEQRKLFFNLRKMKKRIGWLNQDEKQEIANYLNVDVSNVAEMESRLLKHDSYFDETFGECKDENLDANLACSKMLEDHSTNPESKLMDSNYKKLCLKHIRTTLSQLDERSQDIISNRWLVDIDQRNNLKELAERHGVSAERIRQIEHNSLLKMRRKLEGAKLSHG